MHALEVSKEIASGVASKLDLDLDMESRKFLIGASTVRSNNDPEKGAFGEHAHGHLPWWHFLYQLAP